MTSFPHERHRPDARKAEHPTGRFGPGGRFACSLAVAAGFEPAEGVTLTRFRGVLLRPLGHTTAEKGTRRGGAPVVPVPPGRTWQDHVP